jgi:uncharacterized protein YbaP (TraB family)
MYYEAKGTNLRIAGSMHFFPAESPAMPAWVWEAYDWCEHLVIECDSSNFAALRLLPEKCSLQDRIPADVWRDLSALWPVTTPLTPLKPWAAMLALPSVLLPLAVGVESQIVGRAKADAKPVSFLETGTDIAQLLDTIPDSICVEALAFMVRNPDFIRTHFHSLHTAWMRRDLASVFAVVSQSPLWKSDVLREVIVGVRNRAWMPLIREAIPSKERRLIFVGALHLCGEDGLAVMSKFHDQKQGHLFTLIS